LKSDTQWMRGHKQAMKNKRQSFFSVKKRKGVCIRVGRVQPKKKEGEIRDIEKKGKVTCWRMGGNRKHISPG